MGRNLQVLQDTPGGQDDTVYAITLGALGSGERLVLGSFAAGAPGAKATITRVTLLGQADDIAWKLEPDGLHITTPDISGTAVTVSFKIETEPPGLS